MDFMVVLLSKGPREPRVRGFICQIDVAHGMYHRHEYQRPRLEPVARLRCGAARTQRDYRVAPPALTQPAVSNALARLRTLFDDPLFVRTPSGMEATPFGRGLAEPVRQALALLESALAHGPGFDPANSTRAFRFYMSDLGQVEFLPPLIERVQRRAPGVRLEAVALEVEDIDDALAAGPLALAVGFLPGLGQPVRRQPLFRDPYVCLMRADHPLTGKTLSRKKLLETSHVLVSYRGGHRVIEEALERAGLARRIALRVPHFTVVPMVLE